MHIPNLIAKSKKPLIAAMAVLFVVFGTLIALRWARGYRPSIGKNGPTIAGTGLLVASSDPKGAQVFIDGRLTTATDDTLNLTPGTVEVEIKMDGFTTWKKTLKIVSELVNQTNTKLFPSVPNLTPLTFTGAKQPVPSADGQKIAYLVDSASTQAKNGVWILDLSNQNFGTARPSEPRQIARNTSQYNFLDAKFAWTPDSSQLLAYWTETKSTKSKTLASDTCGTSDACDTSIVQAVLLSVSGMNDEDTLKDATPRLPLLIAQWHQDLDLKDQERLKKLPDILQQIATESASSAYFSPDDMRLFYAASSDISIPPTLIPDLPSESTQREERDVHRDGLYVYDIKEDKNFRIGTAKKTNGVLAETSTKEQDQLYWETRLSRKSHLLSMISETKNPKITPLPPVPSSLLSPLLDVLRNRYSPIWVQSFQWFPTSAHLIHDDEARISVVEYDGTNDATVYAGPLRPASSEASPLNESFVYPWPNGSRLIMLTSLNSESPANLYAINLK